MIFLHPNYGSLSYPGTSYPQPINSELLKMGTAGEDRLFLSAVPIIKKSCPALH
mgnify:CR=1 FL=1